MSWVRVPPEAADFSLKKIRIVLFCILLSCVYIQDCMHMNSWFGLSLVYRAPMANTIAACVGSKEVQSLVACPYTIGNPITGSFVKFNRKQMQEALR